MKSVVSTISSYAMSAIILPKVICKFIDKKQRSFWWGQKSQEKKIQWVWWESIRKSKKVGGMGFRDL